MNKRMLNLPFLLVLASPLCAFATDASPQLMNPMAAEVNLLAAADTKNKNMSADMKNNDMKKHETHMREMWERNEITPSAEPSVCGVTPFITADFIWWKAQEDGLDYAFGGTDYADYLAGETFVQASRGTVKSPHFSYEPGFKVGAGLKFDHDGWDLFAQYTWWRNSEKNSKSHITEGPNSFVILASPLHVAALADGLNGPGGLGSGLATPAVSKASATWSLHFNTLDLDLGRNFWISKYLTMRPFIGTKFSWMSQRFALHLINVFENTDHALPTMKLNQWAAGIRAGLNTNWFMCKHLAIFGNLAIDSIWNHFHTTRKNLFTTASSGTLVTDQVVENVSRTANAATAVIECALGLHFEQPFHCDRFLFLLDLSWEQQIWFNQNRFFLPPAPPADLSLSGLTLKAGLYF